MNLKEIRKRKRYVLERFKNTNDIKEKEALSLTFMNYMNMLENCVRITLEDCRHVKLHDRILTAILRVFAPLM